MNYSPPGSSVHWIFQVRILEWGSCFLLQAIFPTQDSKPHLLHWQADSLPLSNQRSPFSQDSGAPGVGSGLPVTLLRAGLAHPGRRCRSWCCSLGPWCRAWADTDGVPGGCSWASRLFFTRSEDAAGTRRPCVDSNDLTFLIACLAETTMCAIIVGLI